MILLTLPVDSPAVQVCVKKYLWWSAFQGSLMLLQNRSCADCVLLMLILSVLLIWRAI